MLLNIFQYNTQVSPPNKESSGPKCPQCPDWETLTGGWGGANLKNKARFLLFSHTHLILPGLKPSKSHTPCCFQPIFFCQFFFSNSPAFSLSWLQPQESIAFQREGHTVLFCVCKHLFSLFPLSGIPSFPASPTHTHSVPIYRNSTHSLRPTVEVTSSWKQSLTHSRKGILSLPLHSNLSFYFWMSHFTTTLFINRCHLNLIAKIETLVPST